MSTPEPSQPPENAQAEALARNLARTVVGRDPTPEEAESLVLILRSTAQALREGFIRRLANHVAAERTDEALEGFFEDQIHTD